jgi:monoamine oxidase
MRSWSRRQLIAAIGHAGGAAAAYDAMMALGLLQAPARADPPRLSVGSGEGTKVLILGSGIAGMVSAYELIKAGYDCTILEARSRPGGRNWSLRSGDTVAELDSTQGVDWDDEPHMYFNPGPARIPYHHNALLAYCRELSVPVEIIANDNRGSYLQDNTAFDGKPQLARAVVNDARGFVAELAAKAACDDLLSKRVSAEDKERLLDFLRSFGVLDKQYVYRGSERSGYAIPPGAGIQACEAYN